MYKVKKFYSFITLLLLSTLAFGQVPNTFSSGETISSSKINANFAYLANAIKNDDITAMMICRISGYSNSTNKLFYGLCSSTDEQSFQSTFTLHKSYFNAKNNLIEEKELGNLSNCISQADLFNNNWVLFDSDQDIAIHSVGNGASEHTVYFLERHVFYKVSSD